jgi:hypothetical protein
MRGRCVEALISLTFIYVTRMTVFYGLNDNKFLILLNWKSFIAVHIETVQDLSVLGTTTLHI